MSDTVMAQLDGTGVSVPNPMPDIELQDEAPAESQEKREDLSGPELTSLFRREATEQGDAVRGPIYLDELVDEDADIRPAVYYKRLTRDERLSLQKRHREMAAEGDTTSEDVSLMIFIERARGADGKRLFATMQLEEAQAANWNAECISRVVGEMADGSRTRLSDEDLGNS